jgi:hypothetical protein
MAEKQRLRKRTSKKNEKSRGGDEGRKEDEEER